MLRIAFTFICSLTASLILFSQDKITLTISIDNIKEVEGFIEVYLYVDQETFLEDDKEYALHRFNVNTTNMEIAIHNLPKQNYAYFLYQDINSDQECNLNFVGIPKEPYGFSKDFKPVFSKPKFEQCELKAADNISTSTSLIH